MRRPFHPILFALYPVLALYSLNTALVPPSDVPLPLSATLLGTLVIWGILSLALRNIARGAAGASASVVFIYADGHIWNFVKKLSAFERPFASQDDFLWVWAVLFLSVLALACWKWKRQEEVTRTLNAFGILLLIIPVFSISASWASAWRGTKIQASISGSTKLDTSERPDIYYIILDGYGRSDAIKRVIGVSNDWFIKALRDRGFYIPKESRSNYCETELSISSSLNMDYLQKLLPDVSPKLDDRQVLDKLIDENGVSKYLRKIGYRYEAITSGFPAIHPYSADLWLYKPRGLTLFEGVLLAETPFPPQEPGSYMSQFDSRRIILRSAFENLEKSSNRGTQPRFIFVHLLAPHPPFVFDANGKSVRPKTMPYSIVDGNHYFQNGGTPKEYADGYAGQVTYISKLMLAAVDKILSNNPKPPVIILQGDHGSKLKLDQEEVSKTDLNECFPNLNAYLVPNNVKVKLYDGITPVNSFRLIFNGLFDDRFAQLPDRSFYSSWSFPFRFVEVTDKIRPSTIAK
jgi:hypothetical protein